jgi:hypothetical protein
MNAGFSSSRLRVIAISAGLISSENAHGFSEKQKSRKLFTEAVKGPIFTDNLSLGLDSAGGGP